MFIYALLRLHESLISQILITFSLRTSLPTHQLIFDKLCLLQSTSYPSRDGKEWKYQHDT